MKSATLTMQMISPAVVIIATLLVVWPTTGKTDETAAPPGDYIRGVKLWGDNCARCHNMRDPKEFRDDQWKVITTHMRVRAGLLGQDSRDILTFLQGSN